MKIEKGIAYHCKTNSLANEFLQECERLGYRWSNGDKATHCAYYLSYKEETCYEISEINDSIYYASRGYFENNDNKIVEYEGNQGYPTVIEHIVQGNTVTIKLSNGKIGAANCSLEDNFSIEIGTKLAIERAYSIEKDKEEKYVKVTNIGWANTGDWGAFIGITFPQYVKYFKAHSFPENNQIYRYIGQFQPSDLLVKTYLIQDADTSQVFLINKKGFKFVDKPKEERKFVPYLYLTPSQKKVGVIGEETDVIDVLGNKLRVGDTVFVYKNKERFGEYVICKEHDNEYVENDNGYVMGYMSVKWKNGCSFHRDLDYQIIKGCSYREIKNGKVVDNVKYILEEQLF